MTDFAPDTVFYAIGDVHGLADRLGTLHEQIFADHAARLTAHPLAIIHLGDYVDRGAQSRQVIECVRSLEARAAREGGFVVRSLRGNHEQMLLDAFSGDPAQLENWLRNGGRETLDSYKRAGQDIDQAMYNFPLAHREWLASLPTMIRDEHRRIAFVHGGIDPSNFPDCDPQHHLWSRSHKFFNPSYWDKNANLDGYTIVHGHTPTSDQEPQLAGGGRRINVDTGAVFGGPLTAVVLAEGQPPRFLRA